MRTRLGRPLPSCASADSSASCTVVTLGCMALPYGRRADPRVDVAVLSYPGFTLLVFERLFEPIGRDDSRRRFRSRPRRGLVVVDPETGFSRVRSPGRGVRPSPPTPGRWADTGQPGVAWGSSTPGWPTPEARRESGSGAPAVPSSAAEFR